MKRNIATKFIGYILIPGMISISACSSLSEAQSIPDEDLKFTNSIGMEFVRIEPGSFLMGSDDGDLDEQPVHYIELRSPFYMGVFEVTNEQYEQFDPGHRKLRGKLGFSKKDDEAVVFVTWHDAVAFTEWLSEKEGLPYRLPTEAEWEYAVRAGTTTPYHTGDELPHPFHKNPRHSWYPDKDRLHPDDIVDLTVGMTPPNNWGLYDMHGNVEEWTLDWYGPYGYGGRVDPVGRASGDFKTTRGGSHSTDLYYLRSANRMAALPENKSWLIGFRVVLGDMPESEPVPEALNTELYATGVSQDTPDLLAGPDPDKPYFKGPIPYIKLQPTDKGPFFYHNHQADITELPNGDLMAIWYTTKSETGRYLRQATSRLRYGSTSWDPASLFWSVPDRNDHGNALWWDGDETIYHISGMAAAGTWGPLAMLMRTSTDNGATWSRARLINPEHQLRNQVISSMIRTQEGYLVVAADAVSVEEGGTAIHVSRDEGKSWTDPGGTIAGIHASVVQLKDGRLLAFGRGDNIDGRMPKSISRDMGKTWEYQASEFPPLASTQRLVLLRMKEGPLFFASFADNMTFTDANGNEYPGTGLFTALSYDEGETWPVRKLLAPENDADSGWMETARSRYFLWTPHTAEPRGYMAGTVGKNGVVHLISTSQHYAFNLEWLETPHAAIPEKPLPEKAALETSLVLDRLPTSIPFDGRLILRADKSEHQFIRNYGRDGIAGRGGTDSQGGTKGQGGMIFENDLAQQVQWLDITDTGFGKARIENGATAEIRLRVTDNEIRNRGVDLGFHLGDGNKRHYQLSITKDAIYTFDHFAMVPLLTGQDHSSSMNTFRLAVGQDGLARIYRNGELIAITSPSAARRPEQNGEKPYLHFGATAPVHAEIEYVSFDTNGGFAP